MAQAGVVLDKDQFNCSICLDVMKNPVTIPCGHSYCSHCIQNYWDQDDYHGIYVCPQCRQSFNPRPLLARSTMLADVVEKFKQTDFQEAPLENGCLASANDVECDVCTDRKNRAVKSCLVCLASYCDVHLKPHFTSAAFKKHKLVSASKRLQETICPRHDKLLEVYCRTDACCICYLCLTDQHKGHDTVLADTEIQNQKEQIKDMKQSTQLRIEQKVKQAQELRQAIFSLTRSVQATVEKSDAIFAELIHLIELKRFEVRELVKAQEKKASKEAEQLLEKIQKEVAELKKNEEALEQLSLSEDTVQFLQSCQSLPTAPVLSTSSPQTADPALSLNVVMTAVADFKGLLQEMCQEGFMSIYETVREIDIVVPERPGSLFEATNEDESGSATQMESSGSATQMESSGSATQMESSAPVLLRGLDQPPVSPLNPFLNPACLPPPTFTFSPFGSKLASTSKQRHLQRRPHSRRK